MNKGDKSKYWRKDPIVDINVNQKLYDAVFNSDAVKKNNYYSYCLGELKTFSDLKKTSDKLAAALYRDGIKNEDGVGLLMLNVPEISSALLAINKIGAISFWMDAGMKSTYLLDYIKKNKIKVLFVIAPLLPIVSSIIGLSDLVKIIVVSSPNFNKNKVQKELLLDKRIVPFEEYVSTELDNGIIFPKYDREKPSVVIQSSGSTGTSKSLVHTDFNLNSEVLKMAYVDLPFYSFKKSLICVPPWVVYGLVNSMYSSLIFGNESIFALEYTEDMIYNYLGSFDYSYGVPVCYRYLYNRIIELRKSDTSKDKKELERIIMCLDKTNFFVSGGDKVLEEDLIRWQQEFNTPIINGYGNNEVVGAAVVSPLFANKPGSIGIPMYGNTVKPFNVETEEMLEDGCSGELYISSESLFKGYLNNEEETKRIKVTKKGIEWVKTGDIGYIDKDGYVFINGRSRRLIIDKNGFKISPENIEKTIQSLEYVKECVVVGVKEKNDEIIIYAFVELFDQYKNDEIVMESIKEYCENNIKDYERPVCYEEIDKIPHKANGGKIDFLLLEEIGKDRLNTTIAQLVLNK